MSSDFRKVALIAAALGLIVSLYLALRPDDDAPPPATTAAATANVAPTNEAKPLLNFTADTVDRVHLHGYDLTADVAPRRAAKISFTADAPGRFEVELEERVLPIAELELRP